jgi:capsular polysaccharide biosynthesis protein
MNDTTRQLGGALGIAVLGTIANNAYLSGVSSLSSTLSSEVAEQVRGGIQAAQRFATTASISTAEQSSILDVTRTAFLNGMHNAIFTGSIVMGVAVVLVLIMLPTTIRRAAEVSNVAVVEPALGD